MIQNIPNTAHSTILLPRIQSMKNTLWIGTADIKDLYVEEIKPPEKVLKKFAVPLHIFNENLSSIANF